MQEVNGHSEIPHENPQERFDAVVQRGVARDEANWRQERGPSKNGIPYNYLLAADNFLMDSTNTTAPLEYLSGDAFDPLDLRFTLQTTLNYLAIRDAEGKSGQEETETLSRVMDTTGIDDPSEAIAKAKADIRVALPQDDIETFLPDARAEGVKKDRLNLHEITSLARLILRNDDRSEPEDQSNVHNSCIQLIDRGMEEGLNITADNSSARRTALTTVMEKLQNEDDTLTFFEGHDRLSQKVLYYFSQNPGQLVLMYLQDLERGKPEIFLEGELKKKVEAVLGNSQDKDFLLKYAESVDNRMHGLLNRLHDPSTGEYKVSVVEFIKSEELLHKKLAEKTEADLNIPDRSPQVAQPYQRIKYTPEPFVKAKIDLNKKVPGIDSVLNDMIERHLRSHFKSYDIDPVLRTFGMKHSAFNRVKDRYLFAEKGPGKDYHAVLTPEQAIAVGVIKRVYGRFKPEYMDTLMETIRQRLQEQKEK